MALTLSGTNGIVGAGFTFDPSGASVTVGVGTFANIVSPKFKTTGNGADVFGSGASGAYLKLINESASSNNSHQFTIDSYNASNTYWNKIKIDGSEVHLNTYTGNRATLTNTALTFASGVNVVMASGNGIDFSATSDPSSPSQADNEVFSNYEEGTWTPGISGSTAITGHSYSSRNGFYTRIGDRVFCDFSFVLSAKGTITGTYIKIVNLPYAINGSSNTRSLSSPIYYRHLNASWNFLALQGHEGQSSCYIYGVEGSGGASSRSYPDGTDISNITEMTGAFSYLAA